MEHDDLLNEIIYEFFNRIALLRGSLFHLDTNIKQYSKLFLESWDKSESNKPKFALLSRLIVSDLTGPTDNGWEIHYPTKSDYIVSFENYNKKTAELTIQFSHFVVIQSYEVFESFLKDILSGFFIIKPNIGKRIISRYSSQKKRIYNFLNICRLFSNKRIENQNIDWFKEVRKIRPGKNNKVLFKILRSISNDDFDFEINNNKGINLRNWYNQFSIVRHSITHSNCLIPESIFKNIINLKMLDKYFPSIKEDQSHRVTIDRSHAESIADIITEYAFQIFKNLSITFGNDWAILPNMKTNLK